jgi:hypothetical protein
VNDPIANALNITPLKEIKQEPAHPARAEIVVNKSDDQVENDFEYARRNMYDIIEKGQQALEGILDVADQSQHPRSYEVAANLIKTMSEVNKDLLDLTKKKRDLQPKEEKQQLSANNMAVFVGSTTELQTMLKKRSEGGE